MHHGLWNMDHASFFSEATLIEIGVYYLFTEREWGHYREISDRVLDILIYQYIKAKVGDFPVTTERRWLIDRSYLLYGLIIMDLSLRSIKTNNWPADNFKKTHQLNESYTWAIQSCDTGQRMPFWQLKIEHNIYVHKDVHYHVKHRLHMPWTPGQ